MYITRQVGHRIVRDFREYLGYKWRSTWFSGYRLFIAKNNKMTLKGKKIRKEICFDANKNYFAAHTTLKFA